MANQVAIQIEGDIVGFLYQQQNPGESLSETLRRLLRLPGSTEDGRFFAAIRAASRVNFTDRFLAALKFLYEEDPSRFESAIQRVRGRRRVYFARSRPEITGATTQPRPIPGTPFWVLTNLNRTRKEKILRRVLSHLGYSEVVQQWRCAVLTPEPPRKRTKQRPGIQPS